MSNRKKRKASALQILAAQRNGAKSQGPATPEGRATSARNSARHNMCAKALVLTIEEEAAFAQHQKNYFDEFQPEGEIEFGLVTDMVVSKWRQWRLWTVETAMLDLQMDKQTKMVEETFDSIDNATRLAVAFQALADESKALALLMRYETSMRRMHERCLKTLLQLKDIRKAAEISQPDTSPTLPISTFHSDDAHTEPRPQGSELTPQESIPQPPIAKLLNEPGAPQLAGENSKPEANETRQMGPECNLSETDKAA